MSESTFSVNVDKTVNFNVEFNQIHLIIKWKNCGQTQLSSSEKYKSVVS